MKHYEPSKAHAVIAMTSVAMTAITIGVLVVLPAKLDSVGADPFTVAAAEAATMARIDVASSETRVEAPAIAALNDRSTSPARLPARKHCAETAKNRARVAQSLPNPPDRAFRAQDRAMPALVSAKEDS